MLRGEGARQRESGAAKKQRSKEKRSGERGAKTSMQGPSNARRRVRSAPGFVIFFHLVALER